MHHLVFYLVVKILLLCACSVYVCLCMCVSVFARVAFGRAYFLCTWVVISTALPITEIYIKPEINFILFSLFNYADICCEAELRTWILITLCVFFSPIPSELWGKTALFVMFLPLLEHKELLEEKRHDQFVCLLPLIHTALLSSEHLNWIHYSYKFFLLCSWQKIKWSFYACIMVVLWYVLFTISS